MIENKGIYNTAMDSSTTIVHYLIETPSREASILPPTYDCTWVHAQLEYDYKVFYIMYRKKSLFQT